MTETYTLAEERWLVLYGFYPRLVALAQARGAGSDAEDVVSTVLLRVWHRSELSRDGYWPYLARAVINELADRHRRLQRDRALALRMYVRPFSADVEEQAVISVEATRLLATLVESHPTQTVAMIRLRMSGGTWREIAAKFGRPASSVQSQVRRALLSVEPQLKWSRDQFA
jgi:DNA-directed RNA polymerase specialized sigma24 family protein